MRTILLSLAASLTATIALAQTPYAGMQDRPIKALSAQQMADLNAGRGMGLALPAELNGYPGPLHVIELADKINLTADQLAKMQAMFAAMKTEAIPLGQKLIAQESELDRLFSDRTVTPVNLKAATTAVALTQGELRQAHLKYHLDAAAILTPGQMKTYAELRGYAGGHQPRHRH